MKRELSMVSKAAFSAAAGVIGMLISGIVVYLVFLVTGGIGVMSVVGAYLLALLYLYFAYKKVALYLQLKGWLLWLTDALFPAALCFAAYVAATLNSPLNDMLTGMAVLVFICPPVWAFAVFSGIYELLDHIIPNKKENKHDTCS